MRIKLLTTGLIIIGALIIFNSETIVFSWIESLIGIEAIVGNGNVVYLEDGGYVYTNPGAMIFWIVSVSLVRIILIVWGMVLYIKPFTPQKNINGTKTRHKKRGKNARLKTR